MGRTAQLVAMVQEMPSSKLHGLAFKLMRDATRRDWSPGQEFLWRLCVAELEHRRAVTPPTARRCSCDLCVSPFEDDQWCD